MSDKTIRLLVIIICILITLAAFIHLELMIKYRGRYPRWCVFHDEKHGIILEGVDCNLVDKLYLQKKEVINGQYTYDYLVNDTINWNKQDSIQ